MILARTEAQLIARGRIEMSKSVEISKRDNGRTTSVNPNEETRNGKTRREVDIWISGCSEATKKRVSSHEKAALRRAFRACMDFADEHSE